MKRPCEMSAEERRAHNNVVAKAWRKNNPDKVKAIYARQAKAGRKWADNNPDRMAFLQKRWRATHRDKVNGNARNWKRAHPRNVRSAFKRWREANIENEKSRWAKYYSENRIRLIAKRTEYNKKNEDRLQVVRKRRYQAIKHDPVYVANNRGVQHRRRAAIKRSTVGSARTIRKFVAAIYASGRVQCYYCGRAFKGDKAHIDHVIPISKGGPHEVGNLCCSCSACNLSKGAKLPSKFVVNGQPMLSL